MVRLKTTLLTAFSVFPTDCERMDYPTSMSFLHFHHIYSRVLLFLFSSYTIAVSQTQRHTHTHTLL